MCSLDPEDVLQHVHPVAETSDLLFHPVAETAVLHFHPVAETSNPPFHLVAETAALRALRVFHLVARAAAVILLSVDLSRPSSCGALESG